MGPDLGTTRKNSKSSCGIFFVEKVTRYGVLAVSVQSFLTTMHCKLKFVKTLIEVSLPVFVSSP